MGDSPIQHSPPQSPDVRGAQEQQQQQPEAGGHGWQHRERSTAVWRGRAGGVRLRGEPGRAAAGFQGERGDRGGGRETRTPPAAAAVVAAGGPIPGEEGAAEAESGPSRAAPVSPAELAGEKKSEPGAGVGGERGRSVGGGGGQGGHGGGSCDSQAAGLLGGSRAPRGGGRRAQRRAGARCWGGARARSWVRDPPACSSPRLCGVVPCHPRACGTEWREE